MEDLPDKEKEDNEKIITKEIISKDDLKHEYKDLSDNMRHYGNIEFAAITALGAITTGLLVVFFTSATSHLPLIKCILPYIGMFVAVVFGVISESNMYLWWHFAKLAAKLENDLPYNQYSTIIEQSEYESSQPKDWNKWWHFFQFFKFFFRLRPTMWSIRLFYFGIFIFWLCMIIKTCWIWLLCFFIFFLMWVTIFLWHKLKSRTLA